MPLQLRRGNTAEINAITPLIGELIYNTQTGKIIVGDGTTAGGVQVTTYTDAQSKAAAGAALSGGTHTGISFTYNSGTQTINGTVNLNGVNWGNINGSIVSNSSSTLVDAAAGTITGILANNGGTMTGNLLITRDGYSASDGVGFEFAQHHNTGDAVNFTFYRSRGTRAAETAVQDLDDIVDIVATAQSGSGRSTAAGITFRVDGAPVGSNVPGKIRFVTNNGSTFAVRAEIDADGVFKANTISSFTAGAAIQFNSLISGDISGSVFGDDSSRILDGTNNRVTARSLAANQYVQFPVYADATARDAAIGGTVVQAGMVIFLTSTAKLQVNTTGTIGGWVDLH
jgi:hypothetical protein